MKKVVAIIVYTIISLAPVCSQNINWDWMEEENPNHVHLNVGYDYGITAQFGYSRYCNVIKPSVVSFDYSIPMGKDIFDDFKTRLGVQVEVAEWNNFKASVNVFGNMKQYKTKLVRIFNVGFESSATVGFYKPSWYAAFEFGILHPIVSDVKHSNLSSEIYPEIQDGWYTSAGGYYTYGIQCSKTIGSSIDLSARIGLTNAYANFKDAMLPYYAQLGVIKRL